ncbi:MAG: capsular polysaccharide synthesis protein [Acidimicrobiales bacterium]
MTQTIWLYWEDQSWAKRRPPYLDLCLETIRKHSCSLKLEIVNRESALELLPDLDESVWNALPSVVFRADYVRTRLLRTYGGMWIDIDSIVMAPLTRMLDMLGEHEFVGWGEEQAKFTNGMFVSRPGSEFVCRWIENQDKAVAEADDLSKLPYHAFGRMATEPVAEVVPYHRLPKSMFAPVSWYEWRRFISKVDSPADVLSAETVAIMLWNGRMNQYLWRLEADQVLSSDMLVSRLLRIALGKSEMNQECRGLARLHFLSNVRFSPMMRLGESALRNTFNLVPY